MKQETIVAQKMREAIESQKDAVFATEFYTKKDVLIGIGVFDLRNVEVDIRCGKDNKGFEAYIVSFPNNRRSCLTSKLHVQD